jgi:hypothetical protein
MLANTIKRNARPGALKPRNPLVPAALLRHAGPHGSAHKHERQQARRQVRAALREMNEGP